MKYDDASWHYGGEFPAELPQEAGATHMGMFVAWALLSGYANPKLDLDFGELTLRTTTPGAFLVDNLDGKFISDWLSDEGRGFTQVYYHSDNHYYTNDYIKVLGQDLKSIYHVQDTWENFDLLKPVIDDKLERLASLDFSIPELKGIRGIVQRVTIKILKRFL
jgi:hypothetical protein